MREWEVVVIHILNVGHHCVGKNVQNYDQASWDFLKDFHLDD